MDVALLIVIILLAGAVLWLERGGSSPSWWYDRRESLTVNKQFQQEAKELRKWIKEFEKNGQ